MGTFTGHVYPGACIALLALRWIYCIFYRYFLCQREKSFSGENGRKFKSSLCFPMRCLPHFPLEAAIWLSLNSFVVVGEIISMVYYSYSRLINHLQHITIMTFFLPSPLVSLLRYYRLRMLEGLEYCALMLSLAVTIFVFQHHQHLKSPLQNQVHSNLCLSFSIAFIGAALEMRHRCSPLAAIFRGYSTTISGCYLAAIGFILYPLQGEPWPSDDHHYKELASLFLAWLYGIGIVITIFIGIIAKIAVSRMSQAQVIRALDFEINIRRKTVDSDFLDSNGDSIKLLDSAEDI